jgi:hypothetical protein
MIELDVTNIPVEERARAWKRAALPRDLYDVEYLLKEISSNDSGLRVMGPVVIYSAPAEATITFHFEDDARGAEYGQVVTHTIIHDEDLP